MDQHQKTGVFTQVEPVQRAAEVTGNVLDFWGEVSGQEQGWPLFTPGPPPHSVFPAVELHYPDGEVVDLRSRFEPPDLGNPAPRPPLVHTRLFHVETQLWMPAWYCSPDSLRAHADEWSARLVPTVRDNAGPVLAWMKWTLARYQADHPGRGDPAVVVLKFRYISSPLPGESKAWTKRVAERPYARWRPGAADDLGYLPVEGYDPAAGEYVRFRKGAGRGE